MSEYIDDQYVIYNGTLLSYRGEEETHVIPAEVGGIPIHTIGSGSFVANKIKNLIVSDGIKRIRENAFDYMHDMKNVMLFPSVREVEFNAFEADSGIKKVYQILSYTDEEYEKLKRSCAYNGGSLYMAYEIPKIGDNYYLPPEAFGIVKQHRLPKGIKRLFAFQHYSHGFPVSFDHENKKVLKPDNIFYPAGSQPISNEDEAIPFLFREGFPEPDPITERKNEQLTADGIRCGEHVYAYFSVVFFFDDSNTRHAGGKHYVLGEYSVGYHFWQSLVPRIAHGKRFYLYRRCFLGASKPYSKDNDADYIRYNMFFCDQDGRNRWK